MEKIKGMDNKRELIRIRKRSRSNLFTIVG
jgi:hypothetical protein